ncbi:Major facilitator superfamily domain, general substrate transporter [Penicillium griseofulvum]|uniref:Major facilitator superfamily domain, general substrate transporter n=1 Tax=Penicillium patulum TaxID=5078 RepID=A0A135L9M7_PENPA|nr:Major facilitator superfamily domain, general substrate transporter [Penicillium griseofulvum]KXG45692.1 Major facilitator superfamily domain, general substrate transporter [Penicillium griseofulvum]
MSIDEIKTAQISASSTDGSDEEWQKSEHHKSEGAFEAREGHHFYRPIDSYEGLHRWDPNFQWTEAEEKKIVRKIDARVCTFACVTFFALQLDRGNIGQALASTLLADLEGGFIPDTILFLSFFYKSSELPKRLTWFWISYTVAGIIGSFLAFGFLHITDANGRGAWRYLFAYEGLITGVIGIIAAFWMPASPVQTKGGLRGKNGWFTEHEEKIIVNRVIRDDPSKGSMHNRQAVTPRRFWESLKDYHMWPIYALGLIWMIPSNPAQNYLTLQLRSQGFTTFQTNLLTIPAAVIAIITMTSITWVAERTNQRLLWGVAVEVWHLALLIALELLPQKSMPWPRWAILTLLVGGPNIHPVIVALTSRNAGSVRTRTVASALYNMSIQLSSIAGANVYQAKDAPYYRNGNKVLIALAVVSGFLFIFAKFYYDWWNRRNSAKWNAMTREQRELYLRENPVLTNKRIDFRFAR